jgi:hypothetical protein
MAFRVDIRPGDLAVVKKSRILEGERLEKLGGYEQPPCNKG